MRATKPISAAVQSAVADLSAELHHKSGCEKIGLTRESFATILCEVATKYLPTSATHGEARAFLLDLARRRTRAGPSLRRRTTIPPGKFSSPATAKSFISRRCALRARIRPPATSPTVSTPSSTAPLTRDGERISKLASFTGRGSLEGWLRTVLAQEFVNRYRRTKRLVSLDEESEDGAQFAAPEPEPLPSADSRLESATDAALAALIREDRMVLAAYYLDGRTLAEIARMLGVHESTISRKVDKLAKSLRKKILAGMMQQGMARRQAEEALEVDVRDLRVDIRRSLAQDSSAATFSEKTVEAKTRAGPGVRQ